RIGNASIARRSRSCASPPFGSCSESYAIRPKLSGQTLRLQGPSSHRFASGEGDIAHKARLLDMPVPHSATGVRLANCRLSFVQELRDILRDLDIDPANWIIARRRYSSPHLRGRGTMRDENKRRLCLAECSRYKTVHPRNVPALGNVLCELKN